jgi:hypothetical protein
MCSEVQTPSAPIGGVGQAFKATAIGQRADQADQVGRLDVQRLAQLARCDARVVAHQTQQRKPNWLELQIGQVAQKQAHQMQAAAPGVVAQQAI